MLLDDATQTPFQLTARAFPAGRLRVLSFQGREAVSELSCFDITIAVSDADAPDLEAALLGEPATLAIHVPDGDARMVSGIIADVEVQAAFEQGRHAFCVQLVPRLWLLGKRATSRIFQNTTVPQIVTAVLDLADVRHRWALVENYTERVYCVQHQETDLAFVTRLLAEEGIFYFFEHAEGGETLVLCDSAQLYEPIAGVPELAYRYEHGSDGMVPKEHHVSRFSLRRTIEPGAVLQRDYDFRRPLLDLRAEARSAPPPACPATNDVAPFEAQQLRVYDHHGEDERPAVDGSSARMRLEQLRRRARVAHGSSACRRLVPGFRFELVDHDIDALNGSYAVTRVEHAGRAPEIAREPEHVYESTFACVPADVPMRPERPARRLQQVTETAIVVGPKGEEIYTDAHGRVKVQFPWDLDGERNEHSSCWVRVAQAWSGQGWGTQYVPRIGMEVIVTFLGGDTDRPLITGCVPNAVNVPPFALPAHRTKSGLTTRSTPGGHGYNELSFEDRKGEERIHVHAERDLDEVIGRNRTCTVKADDVVTVHHDRRETIEGDRTLRVHGCSVEALHGGSVRAVEGDARESVAGHAALRVGEDFTMRVSGRERREITGTSDVSVKDDVNVRVRGCHTMLVGSSKAPRSYSLHVEGLTQLTGSGTTEIRSDKALVLSCGRSSIRITDNKIEIVSPAVSASGTGGGFCIGEDTIRIKAKADAQVVAERVLLKTPDASVSIAKDAQIDGRRVLLNSPDSATDPVPDKSPKTTTIELVDQRGKPLAHRRYLITLADGSEVSGILDKDGKAEVEVEGAGTITFPGLRGAKAA